MSILADNLGAIGLHTDAGLPGRQRRGWGEPQPHRDAPPDRGCHLSPSCLNCPRERCIEDLPPSQRSEVVRMLGPGDVTQGTGES
jgi:hypothetical protein